MSTIQFPWGNLVFGEISGRESAKKRTCGLEEIGIRLMQSKLKAYTFCDGDDETVWGYRVYQRYGLPSLFSELRDFTPHLTIKKSAPPPGP